MNEQQKKLPLKFILFSTLILVAIFVVENINHRFWLNDFKVYYGGVHAFLRGTTVYGTLFALGSGYYKYSPFTLLLVLPVCLFPYSIASVIQYFLLAVSILALFLVCGHIINKYLFDEKTKRKNLLLGLAFVCVINHLVRELHLGNINVVLLLLLCLSLLFNLQSKNIASGMLLAVVVITKPFFALLLLPLLFRNNFKVMIPFGISIALFMLCPALIIGFTPNIELHKEWLHTLLEHNSSFPSNHTIESLVKLYISPNLPVAFQFYVMIAACIGYIIFFFLNQSAQKKNANRKELKDKNLIIEWFVLIAIMPSLFKTDTQHFLLSLPLIMILLLYVVDSKRYILIACFIALIFLYGGNSSDMVGKALSERLNEAGILGISNLIILLSSVLVCFKLFQNSKSGQEVRPQ